MKAVLYSLLASISYYENRDDIQRHLVTLRWKPYFFQCFFVNSVKVADIVAHIQSNLFPGVEAQISPFQ